MVAKNSLLIRDALAELIGTFMLLLFGAGVGALGAPLALVALAHGLILIAIVATYGTISGAHVNPAITLALLVGHKLDLTRAVVYWIAQFAGALAGALVVRDIAGLALITDTTLVETTGRLTTYHLFEASFLEALFTFVLASVYVQTIVFSRAGLLAGLGIGMTFAACMVYGGPLTGASMNPARTLSLALIYDHLSYVPAYVLATLIGGALGGWVQCTLFKPSAAPKKVAEG